MLSISFYSGYIDFYWFLLIFIDFSCYLQYFFGVMAILLGSGAPKVIFYCYLHYFNIRSTDAIYFFVYWISLIWFFYLDFSYWTVLLDFDYHHVLDLGTFEKTAWILIPERPFLISFSALVHSPTRWDFAYWISFIGFSYLISLIGLSYWISLIWLSYWISPTIFISKHTMDVGSWVGGIAP